MSLDVTAAVTALAPMPQPSRQVSDLEESDSVEPLGPGWIAVTVVIGVMASLIALGGMVLSFRAVSTEMVPAFGARWAWLVPVVVDLTVFVFSGVDLVLSRLDMAHPLARWTVYGATGGTVWLNYSAGGSAAGRVAHVLMPAIWVVFVELMRHVVRRQVNLATGNRRQPIPAARWLLSPWPTLKLWRRMVLWRINSYPRALDQEKQRLGALAVARATHGRLWRYRISPLTRLQINLGELGPESLRPAGPDAARPTESAAAPVSIGSGAPAAAVSGRTETQPETSADPIEAEPIEAEPIEAEPTEAEPTEGPIGSGAPGSVGWTRSGGGPDRIEGRVSEPIEQPLPAPPQRRWMRESELLTAAREVERWRGSVSATRISRELGIGMPLATSLANALMDEEQGLGAVSDAEPVPGPRTAYGAESVESVAGWVGSADRDSRFDRVGGEPVRLGALLPQIPGSDRIDAFGRVGSEPTERDRSVRSGQGEPIESAGTDPIESDAAAVPVGSGARAVAAAGAARVTVTVGAEGEDDAQDGEGEPRGRNIRSVEQLLAEARELDPMPTTAEGLRERLQIGLPKARQLRELLKTNQ